MRLLIIDDDVQIREGIQEGIDWNALGVEKVCTCPNGLEGLELSETFQPDIVLADVKMPRMDGLEFLSRIHEICDAKVIMISGYSDFKYCQTAIRYGAVDYILKPIKVRELIQLISRVRDSILEEQSTKEKFQEYKIAYEKDFLKKLLLGGVKDPNIIRGYFMDRFCNQDVSRVLCVVINVERGEKNKGDFIRDIRTYFEKQCTDIWTILETERNEYLLLMETAPSRLFVINHQNRIKSWLREFQEEQKGYEVMFSAGISQETMVSEIWKGYRQAKKNLDKRKYTGLGSVHAEGENGPCPPKSDLHEQRKQYKDAVVEAILNKESVRIEEALKKLQSSFVEDMECDSRTMRKLYMTCCTEVNEQCLKRGEEMIFDLPTLHAAFEEIYYIEDFTKEIYNVCETVFRYRKKEYYGKYHSLISQALIYIEKHYPENLTTKSVGEILGITPNYFSGLFKKEVGISFREYLVDLRVKKAVYMLEHTNEQIHVIAEKSGFGDYMYFSQVFKKVMGKTPSEFRKGGKET